VTCSKSTAVHLIAEHHGGGISSRRVLWRNADSVFFVLSLFFHSRFLLCFCCFVVARLFRVVHGTRTETTSSITARSGASCHGITLQVTANSVVGRGLVIVIVIMFSCTGLAAPFSRVLAASSRGTLLDILGFSPPADKDGKVVAVGLTLAHGGVGGDACVVERVRNVMNSNSIQSI